MNAFEAHEYADLLPLLDGEALADLARDIADHGQREPILTFEGRILDGRNRWRACEIAGVDPVVQPAPCSTPEEALALVVSLNLHRRHLSTGQRAMLGTEVKARFSILAAARMRAGHPSANLREGSGSKAADQAAAVVGVSARTIEHADRVRARAEPEVVAAVRAGSLAVSTAALVAEMEPDEQREVADLVTTGAARTGADAIRQVEARRPHVAHNTGCHEWYTPPELVNAARAVLGGIDLDPASSATANETIGAARFYTAEDDGLALPWGGRVWLNPPYEAGLVDRFASKLREEVDAGRVRSAIVLVNNATETRWFRTMAARAVAVCFPTGRVRFLRPDGSTGAPLQGQAVFYVGDDVGRFNNVFGALGLVATVLDAGGVG